MDNETYMSNKVINLDNYNFKSRKNRINRYFCILKKSPRSLRAIEKAGFVYEDLIFLDLHYFKEKFPEVITLPESTLLKRYDFYENTRINKIEICRMVKFILKL
jgi:hypothetical protein